MWGVKKLACRAVLLLPFFLKPSFQAGLTTSFQVVTQGPGACSPADIQVLEGFYTDAVALVRAGLNLYDLYRTGSAGTFSQGISFRNGVLFFGLNGNGAQNVPADDVRWSRVRNILFRTQRLLAGDNVLNVNYKPLLYCNGWWLQRIPDNSYKLVEGRPSATNPNAGQFQTPYITVANAYRGHLYDNAGVRNSREVWWNTISRKYHVQSPMDPTTLGMAWDGDGDADLTPRIALVGRTLTAYRGRLVTSRGSVIRGSGLNLYYTGAACLVHEIIHLTAQNQDNDDLYGYGDITQANHFLLDRILGGTATNAQLQLFDRLQYTADAYAWYCLSAYLSSISEVSLDFSTGSGLNALDIANLP
ncbi:hypothetical protein TWF970_005549 [Orbilia oligospora]|uniref:Lysine-specific metallo-endopeptidase domain-containing protein n=1 Tax=Orbilia oligospora TaxID=2813651 RepID=A0A7C8VMG0_ORBOL|nr:hypothetical protein TWF970_005549 [Orbilia oligospora]